MRLIHIKTGQEAKVGDKVMSFRDEKATIIGMPMPHKPDSEGYVYVRFDDCDEDSRFYCGVFDLEWIEREDRT